VRCTHCHPRPRHPGTSPAHPAHLHRPPQPYHPLHAPCHTGGPPVPPAGAPTAAAGPAAPAAHPRTSGPLGWPPGAAAAGPSGAGGWRGSSGRRAGGSARPPSGEHGQAVEQARNVAGVGCLRCCQVAWMVRRGCLFGASSHLCITFVHQPRAFDQSQHMQCMQARWYCVLPWGK
jgi:hypothetical protein